MNSTSSWRSARTCRYIVSLIGISIVLLGQDEQAQETGRDATATAKMVDQIANRNQAPKLVKSPSGLVPVFPKDYDWDEQHRVRAALYELHKDTTGDLWEELVRRADDPRYSLTLREDGEGASTWSVGDFCSDLAYSRLVAVFQRHLPRTKDSAQYNRVIYLDIGVEATDLAKWRKKRQTKSLYQLQVEVCQRALARLSKVKGVSHDDKDKARKQIEAEIETLQTTKRPVLRGSNLDGLETYSAEQAKSIREKLGRRR